MVHSALKYVMHMPCVQVAALRVASVQMDKLQMSMDNVLDLEPALVSFELFFYMHTYIHNLHTGIYLNDQ